MVDALSSADGEESSGTKPNFIARVVESEYQSDDNPVKEEYLGEDESREDYYEHLYELEVLRVLGDNEDASWDNLHEFSLKLTNNFQSKWMVFLGHLENIHGSLADNDIGSYEDMAEFLTGRVYEFREIGWTEDEEFTWDQSPDGKTINISQIFANSDNPPNELIVPVREVGEDEMADLGVEPGAGEAEVEDVDL